MTTLMVSLGLVNDENDILMAKSHNGQELPEGFSPSEFDVICGWARQNYHHAGNRRLRATISGNVSRYTTAKTKTEKGQIIADIVSELKRESPTGVGFVKLNPKTGRWSFIGTEKAKDKIGHALRKASLALSKKAKKQGGKLDGCDADDDSHKLLAMSNSMEDDSADDNNMSTHDSHAPGAISSNSSIHNTPGAPSTTQLSSRNDRRPLANQCLTPPLGKQKRERTPGFLEFTSHLNGHVNGALFPRSADRTSSVLPATLPYPGLGAPYAEMVGERSPPPHQRFTGGVDAPNASPNSAVLAGEMAGYDGVTPPATPVNRNVFSEHQNILSRTPDQTVFPGFLEPSPLRNVPPPACTTTAAESPLPSSRPASLSRVAGDGGVPAASPPRANPGHYLPPPPYFYYPSYPPPPYPPRAGGAAPPQQHSRPEEYGGVPPYPPPPPPPPPLPGYYYPYPPYGMAPPRPGTSPHRLAPRTSSGRDRDATLDLEGETSSSGGVNRHHTQV